MGFFDKAKDYETLTDPFDERLMISVGSSSMSLFMWKKEIREKIKECSDILNEIKNNPLFKKVEELLNKNIVVTEEQNKLILRNQQTIESQNVQINSIEAKLTELNNKTSFLSFELDKKTTSSLTEINNKTDIFLTEINKKTTEVQNISIKGVLDAVQKNLDDFKKNEAERYLKDLAETKTKVKEIINNEIHIAIEDTVNQLNQIANDKLRETFSQQGLHNNKQQKEKQEAQSESTIDDEEFTRPE